MDANILPPLVEVTDAPAGLVELKIRDCRGTRIGFCQVAASDVDDELIDGLVAWAQRHSHRISLVSASQPPTAQRVS